MNLFLSEKTLTHLYRQKKRLFYLLSIEFESQESIEYGIVSWKLYDGNLTFYVNDTDARHQIIKEDETPYSKEVLE